MATHDVNFVIPERKLGKADVEFKVKIDEKAFGTLKVSNGSVVWVPRDKKYGFKINWTDLDAFMQEKGRQEKS